MRSNWIRWTYFALLNLTRLLAFLQVLVGIAGIAWGGATAFSILVFGAMFGTAICLFLWKHHPRTALRISGICGLLVWAGISWHNYHLCDKGPCITHDPWMVILTSLMVPPVLLSLLSWACLLSAWRVRLVQRQRRATRTRTRI